MVLYDFFFLPLQDASCPAPETLSKSPLMSCIGMVLHLIAASAILPSVRSKIKVESSGLAQWRPMPMPKTLMMTVTASRRKHMMTCARSRQNYWMRHRSLAEKNWRDAITRRQLKILAPNKTTRHHHANINGLSQPDLDRTGCYC